MDFDAGFSAHQANPFLSPDDVKCALMSTAGAAQKPDGTLGGAITAWYDLKKQVSG